MTFLTRLVNSFFSKLGYYGKCKCYKMEFHDVYRNCGWVDCFGENLRKQEYFGLALCHHYGLDTGCVGNIDEGYGEEGSDVIITMALKLRPSDVDEVIAIMKAKSWQLPK